MPFVNDFRKLFARSWPERRLLLEAALWMGLGSSAILLLKFRRVTKLLGLGQENVPARFNSAKADVVARIGWAVRTVAARGPWKNTCLLQTVAAAAMMRRRGIPCVLCLGVAKSSSDVIAHAWLRCGNVIVTGAGGLNRFTPISAFATR